MCHSLPVRTSSRAGNMASLGTEHFIEFVWEKSFLYDVKDKSIATGTLSRRRGKISGRRWDVRVIIKMLFEQFYLYY
jgi:hypothetical protein